MGSGPCLPGAAAARWRLAGWGAGGAPGRRRQPASSGGPFFLSPFRGGEEEEEEFGTAAAAIIGAREDGLAAAAPCFRLITSYPMISAGCAARSALLLSGLSDSSGGHAGARNLAMWCSVNDGVVTEFAS